MTDFIPPYVLRLYIQDLLVANGLINLNDYKVNGVQLSPVTALSDDPNLAPLGKPYIIFGFSEFEDNDNAIVEGSGIMSLLVYGQTYTVINNIIRTIRKAFEDPMFATMSINRYSTSKIPSNAGWDQIRFTRVCASAIESADPEETEGGRVSGVVNIDYSYIDDSTVKIFGADGNWNTESNSF